MSSPDFIHSPYRLTKPAGWVLYVSHHDTVRRLVVFVHGFNGKAVTTWSDFDLGGGHREWWREADLLFVGYTSTRDVINAVAYRLRTELPNFFPTPFREAMIIDGIAARDATESPYQELVVMGHSLGGLVVRRALCDAALEWHREARPSPRPILLDAQIRLFSPASAGFEAAGILGAIRASSIWRIVELFLRRSPAYLQLQPGSDSLRTTQERTEELAMQDGFEALRARIAWASPDEVVVSERYSTDHLDEFWDGTTHSTVCKPRSTSFEYPWVFAETGRTRQ